MRRKTRPLPLRFPRRCRYDPPRILSDRDIRARLTAGDLTIDPLLDERVQLQPASVDLRLSAEFVVYRAKIKGFTVEIAHVS